MEVKELFTSDFFIDNRAKLKALRAQDVPIIIPANGAVQRAGDVAFEFKQDSNFWYLTGINEADLILVITPKKEFLILPERDAIHDVFDGAISEDELSSTSGITNIYDHVRGWEELHRLAKQYGKFYTGLYKGFDDLHKVYINPAKPRLRNNLQKLSENVELLEIRRELAHLRMVKQEPEITALQHAVDITAESLQKVFKPGWRKRLKNDAAIVREMTYQFGLKNTIHAYQMVAAAGPDACTIHHGAKVRNLEDGEVMLVDVGAEYYNYAADISRVYLPDQPTKRQKQVYQAVKDVHTEILSWLKPGVSMRKIEKRTESLIGKTLVELGVIKRVSRKVTRQYYPHAFGHHLGLDVHDSADYDLPLAEGMVITVEPGIYIKDEAIGIRIEDDVLITKKGYKNLSANLPS